MFNTNTNTEAAKAAGFNEIDSVICCFTLEETVSYILDIIKEGRHSCMSEEYDSCFNYDVVDSEDEFSYEKLLTFFCDRFDFH